MPTTQEWINTARGQQLHLGRKNLVLNGPVDNPLASCSACHGFAQIPKVNNPMPSIPSIPSLTATPVALDRYFTNQKGTVALSADYIPVDYSLQLQLGIARAVNAGQASLPPSLGAATKGKGVAPTFTPTVTKMREADRE